MVSRLMKGVFNDRHSSNEDLISAKGSCLKPKMSILHSFYMKMWTLKYISVENITTNKLATALSLDIQVYTWVCFVGGGWGLSRLQLQLQLKLDTIP